MSATTTAPAADENIAGTAEHTPSRDERINAFADKEFAQLRQREMKKLPTERRPDEALWKQARTTAKAQVRREDTAAATKKATKAIAAGVATAATSAASDGKAFYQRNRRQMAPWLLAAPYAVTGETAYLLAEYGHGTNPIGVAALAAGAAAAGSWIAWRRKLRTATPASFTERMKAALGLLCGWTAAMPVVPASGQAGMWLALAGGAAFLGLPWWRQHDHPIPLADDVAELDEQSISDDQEPEHRERADARAQMIEGILQAWIDRVTVASGAVPGSQISHDGETTNAVRFKVALAPDGRITADGMEALKGRIALAVGVFARQITFEIGERVDEVTMRVTFADRDTVYNGPIVLCDGKQISSRWEITPGSSVDIVIGGYLDGEGVVSYRVIDAGSVNSAFILGSIGSGKTLLLEQLGIGLRFIGAELWYVDGQDGASSEVLKKSADWTIPLDNVEVLYQAIKGAADARNLELKVRPELENKYTYDPKRPPVITAIEECQNVFGMADDDGVTYGELFGDMARIIRKTGLGFVAVSQDLDLASTFGGSDILRGCLMAAGNFFAMRFVSMARKGMLPSTCPDLGQVPKHGFGYAPYGTRPEAMWRAANIENSPNTKAEWMASFPPAELDQLTRNGAGSSYHRRHEAVDEDLEAARRRYEVLVRGSAAEVEALRHEEQKKGEATSTTSTGQSSVVRFPGAPQPASTPAQPATTSPAGTGAAESLTAAEEKVLEAVRAAPQTPTTLATVLDMTSQGAGKHLRKLTEKGFLVKMENGAYMARPERPGA